MRLASRQLIRAGIVAGFALTALPTASPRGSWSLGQPAVAAPLQVPGLSPAFLAQAAKQPQNVIMLLQPGASSVDVLHTLRANGATEIKPLGIIHGIAARVSGAGLSALQYSTALHAVTLDRVHHMLPVPDLREMTDQVAQATLRAGATVPADKTVISEPDTLGIVRADQVLKQYNGRNVRVALVDSGIDLGHPDLQGVMLKDAAGKPLYADFTGTDMRDTVGHGTAVAGTIAAQAKTIYEVTDSYRQTVFPAADPAKRFNDQTYFTVGGVAPGVKLMAAKIFDTRNDYGAIDSNIVQAIQWAIANHANVISESFGGANVPSNGADPVSMADEAAVRAGITVVASNGNDGSGQGSTGGPADAPNVIAVGASTDYREYGESGRFANYGAVTSDNIAGFSSRGPTADGRIRPDLVAPGDAAWTTVPHQGSDDFTPNRVFGQPIAISSFGGTSQSAPVTAGVAALVINAYMETHGGRTPSPAYVKQVLVSTADNLGYAAIDQGAGRVNALRAVQAVTHQGPAVLLSGAVALHGLPGQHLGSTVRLSNSGNTTEQISLAPQTLHQTQVISFGGKVVADQSYMFSFDVPAGVSKLTTAINWDTLRSVPLPSPQQATKAMLRVQIYDPAGNFVNYDYDVTGSGFVGATAARPVPGRWTAVVVQRAQRDNAQIRHFVSVPFFGRITMAAFRTDGGVVSPSQVTLKPGASATVNYKAPVQANAGVTTLNLQVHETDLSAAATDRAQVTTSIPVVLTTDVRLTEGRGTFTGVFHGGGAQGSHLYESTYYGFQVPANTKNIAVSVHWQHKGNWFYFGFVDPNGKISNIVANDLGDGANHTSPLDLSQRVIDSVFLNPIPGRWQIVLLNVIFAGTNASETYTGTVSLNQPLAQIDRQSVTVQAGGPSVPFTIHMHNLGGGVQAYFGYVTTDRYAYLPLGSTGGTLQNGALGVGSTQALTYTTISVPPGTKEVVAQAQALNSPQRVAIQLDDPDFGTFAAFGLPAVEALGGQVGQGSMAVVQGKDLPIGKWDVLLTLPKQAAGVPISVASSAYGYSLVPNPWISMDAQVDGTLQLLNKNASALVTLPGGVATMHGSVRVPENVAPGSYPAKIFIYSFRGDKLAEIPLTIQVAGATAAPLPTPDPLLAAIVSTQYYGEGATVAGLTDQMDLFNPSDSPAHVQLKLLTSSGWTTVTRYVVGAHARRSVNVQPLVGKDQGIAAIVQADQPVVSGRLIARVGAAGSYSVGTVAPAKNWYFADGYTVQNFGEDLLIANPGSASAHVKIHFVSDQGDTRDVQFTLDGSTRGDVDVNQVLPNKAVSASISSDAPVVAERTLVFGTHGEGATTSIGATTGLTSGYIDPGHLPSGTQAHLSLLNPHGTPANVVLTLIDAHAKPVRNLTVHLGAGRRATVNLSGSFGTANLGATISSNVSVVAEKVAYFGQFGKSHIGGSALLATAAPATSVIFPGGTTASGAGDYINLYNPADTTAVARITVIYSGNSTLQRTVSVAAKTRTTVSIRTLGAPSGASSLIVEGMNGAQFYTTQTIVNAAKTDGSEISGVVQPQS